jgi:hypothetical protein
MADAKVVVCVAIQSSNLTITKQRRLLVSANCRGTGRTSKRKASMEGRILRRRSRWRPPCGSGFSREAFSWLWHITPNHSVSFFPPRVVALPARRPWPSVVTPARKDDQSENSGQPSESVMRAMTVDALVATAQSSQEIHPHLTGGRQRVPPKKNSQLDAWK